VLLNGQVASLGDSADPSRDKIEISGKRLQPPEEKITVLLNKPRGYITSAKDPQGRRLVTELVSDIPQRLFPVGRLDYNTEGLLLLTNDGDLSLLLTHPRHHVEKTYLVKVRGQLTPKMAEQLQRGVDIGGYKTARAQVAKIRPAGSGCWFELTIAEGKNRQVRRMCEALGVPVVKLKRVRLGFLDLDGLAPGCYRKLTAAEIAKLRKGQ